MINEIEIALVGFGMFMQPYGTIILILPIIYLLFLGLQFRYPVKGDPVWNKETKKLSLRLWGTIAVFGFGISMLLLAELPIVIALLNLVLWFLVVPPVAIAIFLGSLRMEMERRKNKEK